LYRAFGIKTAILVLVDRVGPLGADPTVAPAIPHCGRNRLRLVLEKSMAVSCNPDTPSGVVGKQPTAPSTPTPLAAQSELQRTGASASRGARRLCGERNGGNAARRWEIIPREFKPVVGAFRPRPRDPRREAV